MPCATCAATCIKDLKELVRTRARSGEDDGARAEEEVQKLTDAHVKEIDELLNTRKPRSSRSDPRALVYAMTLRTRLALGAGRLLDRAAPRSTPDRGRDLPYR